MKEIYISKKELEQRERQEYEKNLVAMLSKGSCMRRYRIIYKVTRIAGNEFSKEYVVHADNPVEVISKGNARLRYDCLYNFNDEVKESCLMEVKEIMKKPPNYMYFKNRLLALNSQYKNEVVRAMTIRESLEICAAYNPSYPCTSLNEAIEYAKKGKLFDLIGKTELGDFCRDIVKELDYDYL